MKKLVALLFALGLCASSPAFGASGCTYPTSVDAFVDKLAGDFLTIADINKRSCAIEKLETGPLRPNDGTAAAPAYAFRSSATAGMFLSSTNQIDFSTSSTAQWRITPGGNLEAVTQSQNLRVNSRLLVNTGNISGTNLGDIVLQNIGAFRWSNSADTTTSTGFRSSATNDVVAFMTGASSTFGFEFGGSGVLLLRRNQGGGGIMFVGESAIDQDAPAANGAVLYTRDNTGGKTQLCVRFATGAAQCFATEP